MNFKKSSQIGQVEKYVDYSFREKKGMGDRKRKKKDGEKFE